MGKKRILIIKYRFVKPDKAALPRSRSSLGRIMRTYSAAWILDWGLAFA